MNYEAFFKLSYGLYIVSTGDENEKRGFVANAVFQVTAEPPQFAVCCNKNNHSFELIKNSGRYSVSVLNKNASSDIIGTFGYKTGAEIDKFEKTKHIIGTTGVPIVTDECIAWFECEVVNSFDVGSHYIFIGRIVNYDMTEPEADPLTYAYYREVKKGFAPKNAPTYIDKSKLTETEAPKTELKSYECQVCSYVYDPSIGDPDGGIAPGTPFEDIPDDWECPVCGTRKTDFAVI